MAPLSVVQNWANEVKKWLGKIKLDPIVAMGKKEDVQKVCKMFSNNFYRLLLISYESFMTYSSILNNNCDLLILDEGHRLKNDKIKTYTVFNEFSCKRRIILSGTPL